MATFRFRQSNARSALRGGDGLRGASVLASSLPTCVQGYTGVIGSNPAVSLGTLGLVATQSAVSLGKLGLLATQPAVSLGRVDVGGGQPAVSLGALGIVAAQSLVTPALLARNGSQPLVGIGKLDTSGVHPAFVRTSGDAVIAQTLYVGGATFPLLGDQPLYGNGIATLTGQQPVMGLGNIAALTGSQPVSSVVRSALDAVLPIGGNALLALLNTQSAYSPVVTDLLASAPGWTSGAAEGYGGSQPAYGRTRLSLAAAQPFIGVVRSRMIAAQPAFVRVGAIAGIQGMMVRGFPELTVTPNIMRQQYAPVQVVEIAV